MGFRGAVFCGNGNHTALGEVFALRIKLGRGAAHPATTKKENDGGTRLAPGPCPGWEDMQLEVDRGTVGVGGSLVNDAVRLGGSIVFAGLDLPREEDQREGEGDEEGAHGGGLSGFPWFEDGCEKRVQRRGGRIALRSKEVVQFDVIGVFSRK